jgi:hypothetical protein
VGHQGILLQGTFSTAVGGIFDVSVDVSVASFNPFGAQNVDAGEFTLLVNGTAMGTVSAGVIDFNEIIRYSLTGRIEVAKGACRSGG